MRQLKPHEQKLLRKVNLYQWKRDDNNVREAKIIRKYGIQDREDYTRYNKLSGLVTKVVAQLRKLPASDEERIKMTEVLLDKLYTMGVIPTASSLDKCVELSASSFARRRLSVVVTRNHFTEQVSQANRYIEQGHISIGPDVVTDPAMHVTREMEDCLQWSQGSKVKRNVMEFNEELDDFELMGPLWLYLGLALALRAREFRCRVCCMRGASAAASPRFVIGSRSPARLSPYQRPSSSLSSSAQSARKMVNPIDALGQGSRLMVKEPAIVLTEKETAVFKVIMDTIHHFQLNTVPRAAGGWVRDKLLGKESDDIDIAVDDMSGETFAYKVKDFLATTSPNASCSSVGVVRANPDQSKHLETATLRVLDISLDVNNLRTETYTQDSRIPVVALGTPQEDASRRDFTINALFYNLRTASVEDFTGKGLEDLRAGIIRTPLEPTITFQDDPLRILRAVRFSTRLGFRLDDGIVKAASDPNIYGLLLTKVSRERWGV
ncbi:CCA tRNA nucleotidyltransferase, mitochondrial, partial [Perkinsus olseni]